MMDKPEAVNIAIGAIIGGLIAFLGSSALGLFKQVLEPSQVKEVARLFVDNPDYREVILEKMADSGKFIGDVGPAPSVASVTEHLKKDSDFIASVKGDPAIRIASGKIALDTKNHDTPRSIRDTSVCKHADTLRGIANGEVKFEKPFDEIPVVEMGLNSFEINHEGSDFTRLHISVKYQDGVPQVTKDGFEYEFYVWCRTDLNAAQGWWIAYSQ